MDPAVEEDQEIGSSSSENLALGLIRDDIRQIIERTLKIQDDIVNMQDRIKQLSQQIELERSLRRNAEALHRRGLHSFMTKLRNLADDYICDANECDP